LGPDKEFIRGKWWCAWLGPRTNGNERGGKEIRDEDWEQHRCTKTMIKNSEAAGLKRGIWLGIPHFWG